MANIFPIILSGGSGTRLWPLSRTKYPKQFIRFTESQDLSILQTACLRLPAGDGFQAPTLLCNEDHRFLVREQLEAIGVVPRKIILEPVARNTAPAITIAALSAVKEDPAAVLVVMPSDHVIVKPDRFAETVRQATEFAAKGNLVLFLADFPSRKKQLEKTKRQNKGLAEKYRIKGFPTVLLLKANGNVLARTGYRKGGASKYVEHVKTIVGK